jgi:carbonic anhydrase/acetyltransferase-like protein (isoleucine patch superfamily)
MMAGMLVRHRGVAPSVDPTAFVAPTATLVGDVRIGPRARVMYGAVLDSEGSRVSVGEACVVAENAVLRATAVGDALVHARAEVPSQFFVPPHTLAVGTPARVLTPDQRDEVSAAIRQADFARAAFGVQVGWEDRITRYEQTAEVRVAEFGAHLDDETVG